MTPLETLRRRDAAILSWTAEDWKRAEQAVFAEVRRAPRKAAPLVAMFEREAARAGTDVARGRAARLRASWLAYRGRRAASVPHYRRAVSLLDGAARDGARIGLAAELTRLGRTAAARALFAAARRDARRRKDPLLEAGALLNEATALHERGDAASALPRYRGALVAFRAAGNAPLAAAAQMNVARALTDLTRPAEAVAAYDEAVLAMDAAGLAHDAARARHNRALLHAATDRLGDADAALRDAEDRYRRAGDDLHAAIARRDRGELLLRAGMLPEARALLASSLRSLRRMDAPDDAARAALLAARAAETLRDASRALRTVRLRRGDAPERAEILALKRGDRRALERLAAAPPGGRRRDRAGARARLLAAAARAAATSASSAGRALAMARDAAALARRAEQPSAEFAAHAAAFSAASILRRADDADTAISAAADALDRVREGLASESMRSALLAGREGFVAAAVRHRLDVRGDARGALALLERWRARSLVDVIDAGAAPAPDVARVRARIRALERAAASGGAGPALRSSSSGSAAVLAREERRLAESLERTSLRAAAPRAGTPSILDLPDDAVAVSLLASGGRTTVLTAHRGAVLGAEAALDAVEVAGRLRFLAGSSAHGPEHFLRHEAGLRRDFGTALSDAAGALRDAIGPALRSAGVARVIFVPDGAWHGVPFAALPFDGAELGDRFAVTCAPSLASLSLPPTPPADGPALVLAPGDADLPASLDEARRVAAACGVEPVLGAAATSDALVAARRPSYLHVAAHGRRRADFPAASGLRLADGWFTAAEFARLDLSGSVVVLSGCETGVHGGSPGGEIHGLVRAAFAAGATDVVASLWRIGDAAAAAFMGEFHVRRAAGASVAAALAGARTSGRGPGIPPWHSAAFVHFSRRR